MTSGQCRAKTELKRLAHAAGDDLDIEIEAELDEGTLVAKIRLRIGLLDTTPEGLPFRERESFSLRIPKEFPFQYPLIEVSHRRWAGFPHVIWGRWLCLYRSLAQWVPEDGLYGFFDRLHDWIGRAAINNMDPVEGNLEPPHHITDSSQIPFVIRENAPSAPGSSWIGVAKLVRHPNRIDLVGWSELSGELPKDQDLALATMLPGELPMEFPASGKELFAEFAKQRLNRVALLSSVKLAALLTEKSKPLHFVVGLPMRRSATGETRMHIAVWTMPSEAGDALRNSVAIDSDNDEVKGLKNDLADKVLEIIEDYPVHWCRVLEDREEILVRRDFGTPLGKLKKKKVLILGCGALGSWVAEMIARSFPTAIDLVDSGIVKPGILVRQNFTPDDYGNGKAAALASRIQNINGDVLTSAHHSDAHTFISSDRSRFAGYDLVLDCTASAIFQMKLERDWCEFGGHTPAITSMILDSQAQRILTMSVPPGSPVGIWDGYVKMKHQLCLERDQDFVPAFYSDTTEDHLFQPEPGCSDPTFVGSMGDVVELSSAALNQSLVSPPDENCSVGIGVASHRCRTAARRIVHIKRDIGVDLPNARVQISDVVFQGAKSFVRQNARQRSASDETGGLLWGRWDEALGIIWVFDISGPPPDSSHDQGRFRCGVAGTKDEHERRFTQTRGTSGFIGFWHTHPQMASSQSHVDIGGMAELVSQIGDNQRRALMLIFGQNQNASTAGIYVYESQASDQGLELISVGEGQIDLEETIL